MDVRYRNSILFIHLGNGQKQLWGAYWATMEKERGESHEKDPIDPSHKIIYELWHIIHYNYAYSVLKQQFNLQLTTDFLIWICSWFPLFV